jgi:hypothetical protein
VWFFASWLHYVRHSIAPVIRQIANTIAASNMVYFENRNAERPAFRLVSLPGDESGFCSAGGDIYQIACVVAMVAGMHPPITVYDKKPSCETRPSYTMLFSLDSREPISSCFSVVLVGCCSSIVEAIGFPRPESIQPIMLHHNQVSQSKTPALQSSAAVGEQDIELQAFDMNASPVL